VLLQQLALLKGYNLEGLDPTGPDFIHLQVECAKLAYAHQKSLNAFASRLKIPGPYS